MSLEFSPEELSVIKERLSQKGINLKKRKLEFGTRSDVVNGQIVIIKTVHIPTADDFQGPVFDISKLLED